MRQGTLRVWCERLVFRPGEDRVEAEGRVVVTDGRQVMLADALTLRPSDQAVSLSDASLMVKLAPLPPDAPLDDPDALRAFGKNAQTLNAAQLRRRADRSIEAEDAEFTVCRCPPGEAPTWSISASSAELKEGEHVDLWWPVFCVKEIPVLVAPWLRVPVGDRRTGLLMPRIDYTQRDGVILTEELFITLGRSVDLTLGASALIGVEPNHEQRARPAGTAELRYHPSKATWGNLATRIVYEDPDIRSDAPDRRPRWHLRAVHRQRFSPKLRLAVDTTLVSDGLYQQHYPSGVGSRDADFNRSRVALGWRDDSLTAWAAADWFQDLRRAASRSRFAEPARQNDVHHLPDIGLGLADVALFGVPLLLGGELRSIHFTTVEGDFIQTLPAEPDADPDDPPPQRIMRFNRIVFRPRLSAPFTIGGLMRVEPWLLHHHAFYLLDGVQDYPARRAHTALGLRADSELARDFEDFVHSIRLELGAATVPQLFNTQPEGLRPDLDHADVATKGTRLWTELSTRVEGRTGWGLRLSASPRWDPEAGVYEGIADLRARLGPVRLDGRTAVAKDPTLRQLSVGGSWRVWGGTSVALRYDLLRGGGGGSLYPCQDLPFGLPPDARRPELCAQVRGLGDRSPVSKLSTLRFSPRLDLTHGVTLGYDLLHSFVPVDVLRRVQANGIAVPSGDEVKTLLHSGFLEYRSDCDCLAVRGDFAIRPDTADVSDGNFTYGFGVWFAIGPGASRRARPPSGLAVVR